MKLTEKELKEIIREELSGEELQEALPPWVRRAGSAIRTIASPARRKGYMTGRELKKEEEQLDLVRDKYRATRDLKRQSEQRLTQTINDLRNQQARAGTIPDHITEKFVNALEKQVTNIRSIVSDLTADLDDLRSLGLELKDKVNNLKQSKETIDAGIQATSDLKRRNKELEDLYDTVLDMPEKPRWSKKKKAAVGAGVGIPAGAAIGYGAMDESMLMETTASAGAVASKSGGPNDDELPGEDREEVARKELHAKQKASAEGLGVSFDEVNNIVNFVATELESPKNMRPNLGNVIKDWAKKHKVDPRKARREIKKLAKDNIKFLKTDWSAEDAGKVVHDLGSTRVPAGSNEERLSAAKRRWRNARKAVARWHADESNADKKIEGKKGVYAIPKDDPVRDEFRKAYRSYKAAKKGRFTQDQLAGQAKSLARQQKAAQRGEGGMLSAMEKSAKADAKKIVDTLTSASRIRGGGTADQDQAEILQTAYDYAAKTNPMAAGEIKVMASNFIGDTFANNLGKQKAVKENKSLDHLVEKIMNKLIK